MSRRSGGQSPKNLPPAKKRPVHSRPAEGVPPPKRARQVLPPPSTRQWKAWDEKVPEPKRKVYVFNAPDQRWALHLAKQMLPRAKELKLAPYKQ